MEIKVVVPDEFMQLIASKVAQKMTQQINLTIPQTTKERYLNIGDAAMHCGVSRSTFDGWRKKYPSMLPQNNVGGSVHFKVSDLDKFMTQKNK